MLPSDEFMKRINESVNRNKNEKIEVGSCGLHYLASVVGFSKGMFEKIRDGKIDPKFAAEEGLKIVNACVDGFNDRKNDES